MPIREKYFTIDEWAEHFQVKRTLVRDSIRRGMLEIKRGKKKLHGLRIRYINIETEGPKFKEYLTYLREKAMETESPKVPPPEYPLDTTKPSEVFDQARRQGMSLHQAKAMKEVFLAKRAKLNYESALGSLVQIADLMASWEEIGVTIQKSLLAIPDRTSQLVASESSPQKCHEIILREVRYTLQNLATDLANMAKSKEQEAGKDEDED